MRGVSWDKGRPSPSATLPLLNPYSECNCSSILIVFDSVLVVFDSVLAFAGR